MEEEKMLTLEKFEEASEVVRRVTLETKLVYSDYFSQQTGAKVFFKPENLQFTGAYKVRGAYYKMSTLTEEERAKGVITASAGNHAQGVAYAIALRERAPQDLPTVHVNGFAVRMLDTDVRAAIDQEKRPRQPHNQAREPNVRAMLLALRDRYAEQLDYTPPDDELNEENILPKAFDPRVKDAVAKAAAEAAIRKADRSKADYYNYYSNRTWGAAATYHLCIDSSVLGIVGTAAFAEEFIRKKLNLARKD